MNVKQSGFALIEVIVAIVVLAGALAGAFGLVLSAGNAVTDNKDRLTATYLAQECLELARNARDTAWIEHLPWDCAFVEEDLAECHVPRGIIQPMVNGEHLIEILGEQSKFSRKLSTTKDIDTDEAMFIECRVSWPKKSGTREVKITEVLTNWRKK